MQSSAPEAVDLSSETVETKKLYGLDDPRTERFGRRCLMARRLVERGVRFVQVYSGGGHNDENWDAHGDVNKNHELHCGETDRPMAALLEDLKSRGLLDETLVVWTGEFGRTPTGQNNKGRDHSPAGSRPGWPAQASRGARPTAPPTNSVTRRSRTRCTFTICTPPSCTSWASTIGS